MWWNMAAFHGPTVSVVERLETHFYLSHGDSSSLSAPECHWPTAKKGEMGILYIVACSTYSDLFPCYHYLEPSSICVY